MDTKPPITFKTVLRRFIPSVLLERRRRILRARERQSNAGKTTQEIFESVYANGKWGGASHADGSGSGSDERIAASYIAFVNSFIAQHPEIKTIVDIGCGDFRVARNFVLDPSQRYLGTDIVQPLVDMNQKSYANGQISFQQLDAVADTLPDADLYLVRQVLQHLSNDQAACVLSKIQAGHYALVTEHQPAPDRLMAANLDKPTGPDVRIYDRSGIYLDQPPFSIAGTSVALTATPPRGLVSEGEVLTTYLVPGRKGAA